jgi:hypothetical protein
LANSTIRLIEAKSGSDALANLHPKTPSRWSALRLPITVILGVSTARQASTGTASQAARFYGGLLQAIRREGTVMNISHIRTRVEGGTPALNERSRLVMSNAETDENPTVNLVDTAQRNDGESSVMPDPLIQALVDRLPKPNAVWSIEDRAKWLRAAAILFNLVYRADPGERKEPGFKQETKETVAPSSTLSGVASSAARKPA